MKFFDKIRGKKISMPVDTERARAARAREPDEIKPVRAPRAASTGRAYLGILRAHRITEKSSRLGRQNTYVFVVGDHVNKPMIKRAVENQYGVTVRSVRTAAAHGKERRRGNQIGWKPGVKKAMVTLKEGEKIEIA